MNKEKIIYADDQKEGVSLLLRLRLPWLLVGLVVAFGASFIVSSYEEIVSQNIALAFFLPAIVYIGDAVGTQTETIYVRNLSKEKVNFSVYLIKEVLLGLSLGVIVGLLMAVFAFYWLGDRQLAMLMNCSLLA